LGVKAFAAASDEEDLAFQPGERVTLTGPPAMAGKQGTVIGPASGNAFAVQFDTGSIFNIAVANMSGPSGPSMAQPPAATAASEPTSLLERGWEVSHDEEELLFQPGQRVTLHGPPAMAGKQGIVVGPALDDAFAIQFDTGSIFNIATCNIEDSEVVVPPAVAAAPPAATTTLSAPAAASGSVFVSDGDEELLFQPGQRVTLNGPPAMAGKQGTVVGPALDDSFAIQFDTGSIFNIAINNIEGSGATSPPAAAAPPATTISFAVPAAAAASAPASGEDEELLFQPGDRVTLKGPPAMAGTQGTVVKLASDDAFAIQFDTGSIFNIDVYNIEGSGIARPPSVAAEPSAQVATGTQATGLAGTWASTASSTDDDLEFQPGERVQIMAPAAMSGKRGEIIAPALGSGFKVMLESGSIFNIETANIQTLATAMA
jgi:hypothetical protein